MKRFLFAALLALAGLPVAPSFAAPFAAMSSASLGQIHIDLLDLDGDDGSTPAFTWLSTGFNEDTSVDAYVGQGDYSNYPESRQYASGNGTWDPLVATANLSLASANAGVTVGPQDIEFAASGSALAPVPSANQNTARYWANADSWYWPFTVTGKTLVIFSGQAAISGSLQAFAEQGDWTYADASVGMSVSGAGAGGAMGYQSSADRLEDELNVDSGYVSGSFSEARTLKTTFVNLTDGMLDGELSAYVGVDGHVSVNAVPEPEIYAMLMIGLGLVGLQAGVHAEEPKRQGRKTDSDRNISTLSWEAPQWRGLFQRDQVYHFSAHHAATGPSARPVKSGLEETQSARLHRQSQSDPGQ